MRILGCHLILTQGCVHDPPRSVICPVSKSTRSLPTPLPGYDYQFECHRPFDHNCFAPIRILSCRLILTLPYDTALPQSRISRKDIPRRLLPKPLPGYFYLSSYYHPTDHSYYVPMCIFAYRQFLTLPYVRILPQSWIYQKDTLHRLLPTPLPGYFYL